MKNLIAVLALLLAPPFAHAVLSNGNFEVGLAARGESDCDHFFID